MKEDEKQEQKWKEKYHVENKRRERENRGEMIYEGYKKKRKRSQTIHHDVWFICLSYLRNFLRQSLSV